MGVFELVFDPFDRVTQGRIKEYSIGFREGELKALLCELGKTKCKCMPFFALILEPLSRQVRWPIWLHYQSLSFSYTLLG